MKRSFKELDALNQVEEFHLIFEHPVVMTGPAIPSDKRCALRVSLLQEELNELKDAIDMDSIVDIADALADLQYVLAGAVLEFGLADKFPAIMQEVHRSNMTKLCKDEIEANDTIAHHRLNGDVGYAEEMEDGRYIVKRLDDEKVLKNLNYEEANLVSILEE